MKQEDYIKNKYGKDSGMNVPEGYFDSLQKQIMTSLPPYQEAPKRIDQSIWQRYKPYIYLAAMFCGIWLMMKVFHSVSQPMLPASLDNPPAALVQLLDDEPDFDWQFPTTETSDYELEEEISMDYDSIEEFEKDFGYTLQPEYAGAIITIGSNPHV